MAVPIKNPFKNSFKVNLLIHKGNQPKLEVRLAKWILSSGRFIVILVELVVISAFVFRYKLDGDLADIQDQIKEQVPYVKSLQKDEQRIRQTQFQLSTVRQLRSNSPNYPQVLTKIATLTPKSIRLTNISLDSTQNFPKVTLTITGQTPTNLELSAFIKALKKDPNFADIKLSNISFEGQTLFTVVGSLNSPGGTSS